MSQVDHPSHYGGKDNPYEAIKVIEAWGLGFNLGNAAKYLSRAGRKGSREEDLAKAAWYLLRELAQERGEDPDVYTQVLESARACESCDRRDEPAPGGCLPAQVEPVKLEVPGPEDGRSRLAVSVARAVCSIDHGVCASMEGFLSPDSDRIQSEIQSGSRAEDLASVPAAMEYFSLLRKKSDDTISQCSLDSEMARKISWLSDLAESCLAEMADILVFMREPARQIWRDGLSLLYTSIGFGPSQTGLNYSSLRSQGEPDVVENPAAAGASFAFLRSCLVTQKSWGEKHPEWVASFVAWCENYEEFLVAPFAKLAARVDLECSKLDVEETGEESDSDLQFQPERTEHQERVRAMTLGFGQPAPENPDEADVLDNHLRIARARLILEEALETVNRGLCLEVSLKEIASSGRRTVCLENMELTPNRATVDMVELADGCADLSVVATGTLVTYGIADKALLEEVDNNNLLKIKNGHLDANGKFVKPKNHPAPDIEGVLKSQGWSGERNPSPFIVG